MASHQPSKSFFSAVCDGNLEDVRKFLNSVTLSKEEAFNGFCYAVFFYRTEVAELLLCNNPEFINERQKLTTPHEIIENAEKLMRSTSKKLPLYIAAEHGRHTIVELLLKFGALVNPPTKETRQMTPLHIASENGHCDVVEILLKNGARTDAMDDYRGTALHCAAGETRVEIVKLLLAHGADIECKDEYGGTPLHFFAFRGQSESVKLLLEFGACVDATDYGGRTPLYVAAKASAAHQHRYAAVASILLENGANVNSRDTDDITPLIIAAFEGATEVVKILLEADADIDAIDCVGRTALHIAVEDETDDDEDYDEGEDTSSNEEYDESDSEDLEDSDEDDADIDEESEAKDGNDLNNDEGKDMNSYEDDNSHRKVILLLLRSGANVNSNKIETGETPLHIYSKRGDLKMTKSLLKFGAEIDGTDLKGRTALYISAKKGRTKVVQLLLKQGANVNHVAANGKTALIKSTERHFLKISEILLKFGADVHESGSRFERTPLHVAVEHGHEQMVKLFLEYGADVDARDKYDCTPLYRCVSKEEFGARYCSVLELLLKFGPTVDSVNSALNKAASWHWNAYFFEILLEFGSADIKFLNEGDVDALFNAVNNRAHRYRFNDTYYVGVLSTSEVLVRYIVKMNVAQVYHVESILRAYKFQDETVINDFQVKCKTEVKKMKCENVGDTNISYYDILTESLDKLASFAKNVSIVEVIRSEYFKSEFPIYYSIIRNQFEKGEIRKNLIDRGVKTCHFMFNKIATVPNELTEKIVTLLNNRELRILTFTRANVG